MDEQQIISDYPERRYYDDEKFKKMLAAELKKVVEEVLDSRGRIDMETHYEDHQFIKEERIKQIKKEVLVEKVKEQTLGWATILFLGSLGYSFLDYIKDMLKVLLKH